MQFMYLIGTKMQLKT